LARGVERHALRRVTAELAQRNLLEHPFLLDVYARAGAVMLREFARGEYQLLPGLTPLSLVEKLVSGQVYLHQLTIVEGWRFADLLAAIRTNTAIRAGSLDGTQIMAELGEPGMHPEGEFFPILTFPARHDRSRAASYRPPGDARSSCQGVGLA
jgi:UPF0755 protein